MVAAPQQQQPQLIGKSKERWIEDFKTETKLRDHKECGLTIKPNLIIDNPAHLVKLLQTQTAVRKIEEKERKAAEARFSLWINTVIFRADDTTKIDDTVAKLFCGDLRNSTQIQERHSQLRSALESLKQAFELSGWFRNNNGPQRRERFECVQKNLDNLYVRKLNEIDIKTANKTQLSSRIQTICSVRPSHEAQEAALEDAQAKYSSYTNVLQAILDKIATLGIVRIDHRAYEPVFTKAHQFTYTYKLWGNNDGELDDLVMYCVHSKEENPELWGAVFDKPGVWRSISRDLEKIYDPRFPCKVLQRETRAFSNGIYDCELDRFWTWDSPVLKTMPNLCPCVYIDMEFQNDEYEYIIQTKGWRALETPELDAICDVQEWSKEERDWWMACLGRMFYPLGKHDRWERLAYHMGRSGCGKSTSIQFWMSYFPPEKVGVLNDNCEKVFGLEPLENTWAWTALDVGKWEGMNQKSWNLMADGGNLPIARKKKIATRPKPFTQPGMFASNQVLGWKATDAEIVRRMFPFFYSKTPGTKANSQLVNQFRRLRLAIALKKLCCAYREKYMEHGTKIGDHMLPEIMQRNLQVILRHTNPVYAFLTDPVITRNPKYYTEFLTFRKSYHEYATRCNLRNRNLPTDDIFLEGTLTACDCKIVTDKNKLPGPARPDCPKNTTWVVGCCVTELEFFQHFRPADVAPPTIQQQEQHNEEQKEMNHQQARAY